MYIIIILICVNAWQQNALTTLTSQSDRPAQLELLWAGVWCGLLETINNILANLMFPMSLTSINKSTLKKQPERFVSPPPLAIYYMHVSRVVDFHPCQLLYVQDDLVSRIWSWSNWESQLRIKWGWSPRNALRLNDVSAWVLMWDIRRNKNQPSKAGRNCSQHLIRHLCSIIIHTLGS